MRMVRIVMLLLQHIRDPQNNMRYIMREDIIDVFYSNKNNNVNQRNLNKLSEYSETRIQTRLRSQKVGMYLLDWLITEEIINQFIELQRLRSDSSVLTYICRIVGVKENAETLILAKNWNLYIK